ncbi:MAG: hypothetical protein LBU65_15550 [Planctomycetaceae bacterium]|jgi:Na+/phosphate symporter|nr:hypothetical protein [Planctomycetaceae bacterium]
MSASKQRPTLAGSNADSLRVASQPAPTTVAHTKQFAKLWSEKLNLLQRMLNIADQEFDFVQRRNFDNLTEYLEMLGVHQKLFTILGDIDSSLEKFKTDDIEKRVWESQEAKDACERTIKQCDELCRKMYKYYVDSESIMVEQKQNQKEKIKHLGSAKASNEYTRQSKNEGNEKRKTSINILD